MLLQTAPQVPTSLGMTGWRRVSLLGPAGTLRAPGQVADELRREAGSWLLTDHSFGRVLPYARLVCHHMAVLARHWAVEGVRVWARERDLHSLARRIGRQTSLM